jgi:hypothetical protein
MIRSFDDPKPVKTRRPENFDAPDSYEASGRVHSCSRNFEFLFFINPPIAHPWAIPLFLKCTAKQSSRNALWFGSLPPPGQAG